MVVVFIHVSTCTVYVQYMQIRAAYLVLDTPVNEIFNLSELFLLK